MADFNHDIPEEYLDDSFDFGFTAADDGDLNELLELDASKTTPDEIAAIKSQLDLILEMNSTCEGANQVKAQYDELLKAKLLEIERAVVCQASVCSLWLCSSSGSEAKEQRHARSQEVWL